MTESFDARVRALEPGDVVRVKQKKGGDSIYVVLRREGNRIVFSRHVNLEDAMEYTGPLQFSPYRWDGARLSDTDGDAAEWFTEETVAIEKGAGKDVQERYAAIPRVPDLPIRLSEQDWHKFVDANMDACQRMEALINNGEVEQLGDIVAAACEIFGIPPTKERLAKISAIVGIACASALKNRIIGVGIIGVPIPEFEREGDDPPTKH